MNKYVCPRTLCVNIDTECLVALSAPSIQEGKTADPESPVFTRGYTSFDDFEEDTDISE